MIAMRSIQGLIVGALGLALVVAVVCLAGSARGANAVEVRPVFADVSDKMESGELHDRAARAAARIELARINREAAQDAARKAETDAAQAAVAQEPERAEPATYAPSEGLTKEGGANYHDGRIETYYSSNVLYHKDTPEWSLDDEGFYRDGQGRYVVAASDMEPGAVFEGSKGECVVLDTGCAPGVTDYYVGW